jgi:MSHA pilin protein MshC
MMQDRLINRNGFTFIELLTVMMIIGIISAIVFSRFLFGDTDLIAQTEVIRTHLRYAQSQAMNSDVVWGIQCSANTYWLFRNGDTNDKVRLPGESSDTVDVADNGLSVESFTLSFDDWGIPHTDAAATDGNELVAADPESEITVSAGSDTRTITVTPNTGFIP